MGIISPLILLIGKKKKHCSFQKIILAKKADNRNLNKSCNIHSLFISYWNKNVHKDNRIWKIIKSEQSEVKSVSQRDIRFTGREKWPRLCSQESGAIEVTHLTFLF